MTYFNYHAKIKKLIKLGYFDYYEIVESYHHISPAMLIYLKTGKIYPIREYRWQEYIDFINTIEKINNHSQK